MLIELDERELSIIRLALQQFVGSSFSNFDYLSKKSGISRNDFLRTADDYHKDYNDSMKLLQRFQRKTVL